MKIIVTGGAGFLGARLISALLAARDSGRAGLPGFDRIVSLDLGACALADPRVESQTGDVSDPAFLAAHVTGDVTAIWHLAAVVSGQAEADFNLGMRINLDGTRQLLEAARTLPAPPRFIFASSLAVFGGALPATVTDGQALLPASSYGAQKAIGELLVADYARKGFVNGVALRLPTVVVRPGTPNAAASSFASGIIREPMAGAEAICPVPTDTRLWLSSPDTVVGNLVHAATLPRGIGGAVNLPGLSVTVAEMLDSLGRIGGPQARARVRHEPDARIQAIVCSWPGDFDVTRALALGFGRDTDFDAVVQQHAAAMTGG
ncbi:MAG: SDR family oxidoreductase [Paracoccaceae bacterium]|nr:MAG: SDR family oxidoreductase [Paracoccaceae bacterium]